MTEEKLHDAEEAIAQTRESLPQEEEPEQPEPIWGGRFDAPEGKAAASLVLDEYADTANGYTVLPYLHRLLGQQEPSYIVGAQRYKTCSVRRIRELANAVSRCIDNVELNRINVAHMIEWARELVAQLDLLDTMLIYEEPAPSERNIK